jgi:hypothetical protein
MTIDSLAEEIGLSDNFTEMIAQIFEEGEPSELRIDLTNGETMMEWQLKTSSGLIHVVKNLVRLIASVDKMDEASLI